MAEILVAGHAGFCKGVRRAVELVEAAARDSPGRRVVTLGPLLHNPAEVERLHRTLGVTPVSVEEVRPDDVVVVRSHGIPIEDQRRLEARPGGQLHDGTCPTVRSCQRIAARMGVEGYAVVLVGEADHPEVLSVLSHAREATPADRGAARVAVVGQVEEARRVDLGGARKVAVLAQTTLPVETYRIVASALLGRFVEVRVFDTLCEAASRRQEEACRLARIADVMIVVGGMNSANTRHLAERCAALQARTHLVEGAAALEPAWFEAATRIGVSAGASTPASALAEVVRRLEEL